MFNLGRAIRLILHTGEHWCQGIHLLDTFPKGLDGHPLWLLDVVVDVQVMTFSCIILAELQEVLPLALFKQLTILASIIDAGGFVGFDPA